MADSNVHDQVRSFNLSVCSRFALSFHKHGICGVYKQMDTVEILSIDFFIA